MSVTYLLISLLFTTTLAALPSNKQESSLIKTELLLRQWSQVNSSPPSPLNEKHRIPLGSDLKAQLPDKFDHVDKRGDRLSLHNLRFHRKLRNDQMMMNRLIKKNGAERIFTDPETQEIILCKEVPYNFCFKVSVGGSLVPLTNDVEQRPIRLLRVFR